GPGAGEVRVADASGTVYDFNNSTGPNSNSWNCNTNGIRTNTFATSMPTRIEDRNGNTIAITQPCGGGSFTISDSTGRTALSFLATVKGSNGLNISEITSVTVAGITQPYQASWTTGTSTQPSLNATTVAGGQGCSGVPAWDRFPQGFVQDVVS